MVDFSYPASDYVHLYSAHAVTPDILHALIIYATYLHLLQ